MDGANDLPRLGRGPSARRQLWPGRVGETGRSGGQAGASRIFLHSLSDRPDVGPRSKQLLGPAHAADSNESVSLVVGLAALLSADWHGRCGACCRFYFRDPFLSGPPAGRVGSVGCGRSAYLFSPLGTPRLAHDKKSQLSYPPARVASKESRHIKLTQFPISDL